MMRTQEEIVARINAIKDNDYFGFETGDLIDFLDFQHAKPFLRPESGKRDWTPQPNTRENILKIMQDYMDFAWEKANNRRGISASRSMSHYSAWIWLLGDEGKFGNLKEYEHYGKDNLVAICKEYGWDHAQWDDGIRTNE